MTHTYLSHEFGSFEALEEKRDVDTFDRGIKSVKEDGYDSLEEVKRYLELNSLLDYNPS
jgi:hypothetical protein